MFFLLVMAAAGLYVFNTAVAGGEYVTVPNITHLSVTQASFELGKVGLAMGRQTPMFSDQVPPYHVISQRPEPGAVVRAGREITATVSQGTEVQETPVFVGKLLGEVEGALSPGVRLGHKARIQHHAPRDQVIGQDPPPGRPLRAEKEVHLLVSKGPTRSIITMPDIVGLSVDEAMNLLALEPLLVERLTEGPAHDFAATKLPELLGHLQIRNESILAHGFSPIRTGEWEQIRSWMDNIFFPMLLAELARNREFRIHTLPPQLPSKYCWRE